MAFTHLHVHTEYSLLDGCNKIKEYVARVKELGMDSAAITDHGVMYGVIEFYEEALKAGINPIIGCEVYVAPGSRTEKEAGGEREERYYHLVLLAENNTGYSNLMKIVSIGFTEGYYYKPRVDKEVLAEYHEGIIALSACLAGEIPRTIAGGTYEEACRTASEYERIFGKGNFFLELQDHGIPEQQRVNKDLLRMSRDLGIPLVATNDVHYTNADDAKVQDILLCIQTNKKVGDEDRLRYEGGQFYVKSEDEMRSLFPYAPEAIENTHRIAERCHVTIVFNDQKLPRYPLPEGTDAWEYLNRLCTEGLAKRYDPVTDELRERLDYELQVIHKMGFVDYFLIVWDFIKYAKDRGIAVGPGRGSAAGSIVAYSLGITDIDPIRYQLLFERFLNPERVSMPDIDVDFCVDRRQEVINYVGAKYGRDCVAQIVTFGTMAARAVVRDVARAMDLPYSFADTIAKHIPRELNITLDKALTMNPELRSMYETDDQVRELIDTARRLEGLPRNTSMHAAGVVISQKPIDEYVPLSLGQDGCVTTQFTMTTLEHLGLLKMDFLGLRTLTVIQNAARLSEKSTGKTLDMSRLSYDDGNVFALIGTGRTEGIFQLESAGMKSFMKELKPRNLEDVIAGISLYRPGPMKFIPKYIAGKNDPSSIRYDCPQLEHILAPTYGCIVYQEQVMQIVRELAGFSMGRSDNLRRAMSKKKADVMISERECFVNGDRKAGVPGCVANGISAVTANKIYDDMSDFAQYAFNKSHAAAYAVVAYQTAYLRYYYPVEFMAALMTSFLDNTDKIAEYIYVCRHQMDIEILPPDIGSSEGTFTVEDGKIRYALSAIKGVGRPLIDAIVSEREKRGKFRDLRDFIERTQNCDLNRRAIENFIKAGAFDSFGAARKQLMMIYVQILDTVSQESKGSIVGQISLFDLAEEEDKADFEVPMPDVGEYTRETLLAFEKEVLGVYISGHPLEEYEKQWRGNISAVTTDFALDDESGRSKVTDGQSVTIGGIVTEKTVKYTKNNKIMAFLTLEDLLGTAEVIVFPQDYEKYASLAEEDSKIFVRGRVSEEEDKPSKLICERIYPFTQIRKELWVQFRDKAAYSSGEQQLYEETADFEGESPVVVYVSSEKAIKRLPAGRNVRICDELTEKLCGAFGSGNIKVVEKSIENISQMH